MSITYRNVALFTSGFETQSHVVQGCLKLRYVERDDLELLALLQPPPKRGYYSCALPHPAVYKDFKESRLEACTFICKESEERLFTITQ